MNLSQQESRFWWRLVGVGALAGALAGALVMALTLVVLGMINIPGMGRVIPLMAIMGGVYGAGQGSAQFLWLRSHIPRMKQAIRANFLGTAVGSGVTVLLLVGLVAIGLDDLLIAIGFSSALSLILGVFIVGGFGGIAQAIVERFLLSATARGSYFRWIAPLALLGHVSGALAGITMVPFWSNF